MVGWRKVWNTAMHYVPRFVLRVLPPLPALCQCRCTKSTPITILHAWWCEANQMRACPFTGPQYELRYHVAVWVDSMSAVLAVSVSGVATVCANYFNWSSVTSEGTHWYWSPSGRIFCLRIPSRFVSRAVMSTSSLFGLYSWTCKSTTRLHGICYFIIFVFLLTSVLFVGQQHPPKTNNENCITQSRMIR